MTGRNGVLKEKVFTGSNQKEAQKKLVMKSQLVLEQRGLREHRHLEEERGVMELIKWRAKGNRVPEILLREEGGSRGPELHPSFEAKHSAEVES